MWQKLVIGNCAYAGALPSFTSASSPWSRSLQILRITDTQLGGPIPSPYLQLPNLQNLELSRNSFNGTLPTPNPGALNILVVTANQLSGPVPSFATCPASVVQMGGNAFTGRLVTRPLFATG